MARQVFGAIFAARAGEDLSAAEWRFVKVDTASALSADGLPSVKRCSVAGEDAYGVLTDKPRLGETASVQWHEGAKVVAGAAITVWQKLATDNQGRAVPAQTGDTILCTSLEPAAAAGQIISVLMSSNGKL